MFARFRLPSRSIVALLCTSLAITLLGATPSLLAAPTVVIFPMRQPSGLDPTAGVNFSNKLGAALKALGGVNVVMGDPSTTVTDYLHAAKAAGSDYYIMGSVAPPVNNAVAVIQQIVSARTGVVVWSGTAYVANDADVASQAPIVKNALTQHSARGYLSILTATPPPPKPSATPEPQKKVAATGSAVAGSPGGPPEVLPNEAYGFSSKPTAPPKVYASAAHPSRFVVLTFAAKNTTPEVRQYTVDALVKALKRHGQTASEGDPNTTGHRLPSGDLCASTGAAYLVLGSVTGTSVPSSEYTNYVHRADASLSLALYDCGTQQFAQSGKEVKGTASLWQAAVERAADAAVTGYLLKVTAVAKSG